MLREHGLVIAMKFADPIEWDLTAMVDRARASRLSNPPMPEDLLAAVATEAVDAVDADADGLDMLWQPGDNMLGCSRAIAVFPIQRDTFDALFNGRSGYRAQYHLSCQEGAAFNRLMVASLMTAAQQLCKLRPLPQSLDLILRSFEGPWSKVWIWRDREAFQNALRHELNPYRWAKNNPASMGLCAPLPNEPAVEFKGTWLRDHNQEYVQDVTWKGDRDCRLHNIGHV